MSITLELINKLKAKDPVFQRLFFVKEDSETLEDFQQLSPNFDVEVTWVCACDLESLGIFVLGIDEETQIAYVFDRTSNVFNPVDVDLYLLPFALNFKFANNLGEMSDYFDCKYGNEEYKNKMRALKFYVDWCNERKLDLTMVNDFLEFFIPAFNRNFKD